MTAQDALESLAQTSRNQALKALGNAQNELCGSLDAKMAEIAAFRSQVAKQTKNLQDLVTSGKSRTQKLTKPQISQSVSRALELQNSIEQINQKVRVLEETQRLVDSYRQ